jgi:voltage-gated potassium channel
MPVRPFQNVVGLYHGLRSALADPAVKGLLTLTFTLVTVASLFYAAVEGWSLLDAAYFAVITIATIGYGDLVPKTAAGKVFTIVYVICGIGIFVAAVGALGEHIANRVRKN